MLIVCGPVRRQHFLLSLLTASVGALIAVGSRFVLGAPRWVSLLGLLIAVTGAAQSILFLLQLQMYGWREDKVTCFACNFCAAQFPTFQEASAHEQTCPYGTGAAVPIGGAVQVVGLPVGQNHKFRTPMGQVVSQQGVQATPA
mmetsp:Transcript_14116/g.26423  ORF Transcript_14116/g.26423 Transcript_14116/m.26423 type:complete len:143 (-) Transcript_14116:307-735(-)